MLRHRVLPADTSRMKVRALLVVVFVLGVAAPGTGVAAPPSDEVHVSAYDNGFYDLFDPSLVRLARGGTVTFDFDGPSSHTATDGSGMDLYDSGVVPGGGPSFSYVFVAAGSYPVLCTLHPEMSANVFVPVGVWPPRGSPKDRFRVRWAAAVATPGSVYDVQSRRPDGAWRWWLRAVTSKTAIFRPDAGDGTYRFRARMREPGAGTSGWSPTDTIRVR
ncbi:MAG TPA: hypothetical protein VIB62_01515 [Actinomycetota bacterium]